MTTTPSEASYIAANEALAAGHAVTSVVHIALIPILLVVLVIGLLMWRREIRAQAKCGAHNFEARNDQTFDVELNKWRTTYVRDVCTRCGDTRERAQ